MLKLNTSFSAKAALFILLQLQTANALKIAVIGGGLSGLTVAYRIEQSELFRRNGHEIAVYEARSRLGGRVFSVEVNGIVEELGAKNIHDGGKAVNLMRLVDELGLKTRDFQSRSSFNFYDASVFTVYDFHADPAFRFYSEDEIGQLEELAANASHLGNVMDRFFKDGQEREIYEARIRSYEGAKSSSLHASYATTTLAWFIRSSNQNRLDYLNQTPSYYQVRHIDGGNARLVEALGRNLPVFLNKPLTRVERADGGFKLSFGDGETRVADIVVMSIPASVLKDVDFEDGIIANEQMDAIKSVTYGKIAKILVPVQVEKSHFGTVLSKHTLSWFDETKRTLTLYYAGEQATVENLEDLSRMLCRDLKGVTALFGDLGYSECGCVMVPKEEQFSKVQQATSVAWGNERYSQGGYSNRPPNRSEWLTTFAVYGDESAYKAFMPVNDRIFFAGEHTAIENPATMEGAVESGERTARTILKLIGQRSTFESRAEL